MIHSSGGLGAALENDRQEDCNLDSRHRRLLIIVSSTCGLVYIIAQWIPLPAFLAGPAGYACIALLPGLALAALLGGVRLDLETEVSIIGLGPVVAGIAVTPLMLAGMSVSSAARVAGVGFSIAPAAGAAARPRSEHAGPGRGSPPPVWVPAALWRSRPPVSSPLSRAVTTRRWFAR